MTRLVVRTVEIDDPGDLLTRLPDPHGVAWLRRGEGFVGWGEAARVPVPTGPGRFEAAAAALARLVADAEVTDEVGLPGSGLVAVGSVTFDPLVGGSTLTVPATMAWRQGGRAWLTTVSSRPAGQQAVAFGAVHAVPAPARIRYAGSSLPEVRWLEAVDDAVRAIRAGELEKVVLARDVVVWSDDEIDARALDRRLAERFPDCFTFAVDGLVGASPELLVRRTGDLVESLVLAGSAPRSPDPEADRRLGTALLGSAKDQAEHAPAVASVRAALEPVVATLHVDPQPGLLRLDNIQHLATGVRGRLAAPRHGDPLTAFALAGRLHPTAAVCGVPTEKAMERIRAVEGMDRGRYTGPVGWVDARGDGEWAIALRCAQIAGKRARLFAGNGIVAGSLPEAELEETRLKLLVMQSAFAAEPRADVRLGE